MKPRNSVKRLSFYSYSKGKKYKKNSGGLAAPIRKPSSESYQFSSNFTLAGLERSTSVAEFGTV
jgi:hypothetical protein